MTTSAPTATSRAWRAHVTFPHVQRVGQRVTFREDDAQIRQALPARLRHSRYPWRWRFGDRTRAWDDHVTHIYHAAGHYTRG